MMTGRLGGRVALITGAASGIGAAVARRFALEGATIVVADIDFSRAKTCAAEITRLGAGVTAAHLDIASEQDTQELRSLVAERFGRLDVLVNNASVADYVGFPDLTLDHFRRICRVNLDGALIVSMAMVSLMRDSTCPRVLNMASIQGLRGSPGSVAYQVAKGGIVNLTRAMACDLAAEGICVNAIAPGFIDTPMCLLPDGTHEHDQEQFKEIYLKWGRIPLRRAGRPEDVAGAAVFLCSEDAAYVTGQILSVDGGLSATF